MEPGERAGARTDQRVPTLIYNGYGEQVAGLYKGMEGERLFV